MESLNTSITLSENPSKHSHPSRLWVNTTSKYQYQKHHLPLKKLKSPSQGSIPKAKEVHRSQSVDNEVPLTPISSARSSQLPSHATIALNFANKDLTTLPKTVMDHTSCLLVLDLSGNNFSEFPQEILTLSKLKSLKIDSNKLKKIPPEVSSLSCLETLSLASNQITSLPNTLIKLAKTLNVLNISHNRIESLPTDITQLVNLKVLWVQKNSFISLPVQLYNLSSLREFALEWFKYTAPPLPTIQSQKNRESILKLFELCKILHDSGKTEVLFEDLVQHFSTSNNSALAVKDNLQRNIVHKTALEEELGLLRYLAIYRKDLVDELDQNNQTPLSLAVREEKDLAAKVLIMNGANPSVGSSPFGSALHLATARQQIGLIKDLLRYGANPNETDFEGNTPLHTLCSIFSKNVLISREIGIMLMGAGADPNICNYDNWGSLHLAIRRNQIDCVKWIIEMNKKNECNGKKSFDLNLIGGSDRWTPLHLAAGLGQFDILTLIVHNNVDILARTKTGRTARDVGVNNILICKVLKKLEDQCIHNHLFNTPLTLDSKLKEFAASSNVFNLKHMIHSSSTKIIDGKTPDSDESRTTNDASDRKTPFTQVNRMKHVNSSNNLSSRNKEKARPVKAILQLEDVTKSIPSLLEESLLIGDVDEVAETKGTTRVMPRSPNNIQKIQIAQNYREHVLRVSSSKDPAWPVMSPEPRGLLKAYNSGPIRTGLATMPHKHQRPKSQHFTFPNEFNKYIKNFENYVEEIKAFQDLLLKESEVCLSEKLKYLFYMQALHMKINGVLGKMNSEMIPVELFILCEHIGDELKKGKDQTRKSGIIHNYDIIPRTLLFVFENLDSRKSSKNTFLKIRISRLFGEFKYDSAKHFLQQINQNPKETHYLKSEATLALSLINRDNIRDKQRNESISKDRFISSFLISPKNESISGAHSIKGHYFAAPNHSKTAKPNKRTQSYVAPMKCENIEDEEESHRVGRQNHLNIHLEKKIVHEPHIVNMGFRGLQDSLPSKLETGGSFRKNTTSTQGTVEAETRSRNLEIKGGPRKVGVENYFSQV